MLYNFLLLHFCHTELTYLVCIAFLSCLCNAVIVADLLLDSCSCKGDVVTSLFDCNISFDIFRCLTTMWQLQLCSHMLHLDTLWSVGC